MKKIDLGLQGGGAHGAFTWGVLDRLLSEERIAIEGISGTSAGAMNAVVVADGLVAGGREAARAALTRFWRAVSDAGRTSPMQRTWLDQMLGRWTLDFSPGFIAMDLMSRLVSPYEMNPLNINPLRDLVAANVDFERVNRCESLKLFISATNVRTGRPHVFKAPDITVDAVMASACLPFMFQAVEIDGEAYWDGGFMGNPVLYPLVDETSARDLVIVQINPLIRDAVPKTARDILNRVNEIDFNTSLVKEIRALLLLKAFGGDSLHQDERLRDLSVHRIHAEHELADLGVSSKMNAEWAFLEHLHDIGWRAADQWIATHWDDLGVRSTYPLEHVLWGLDSLMRDVAKAAVNPPGGGKGDGA
ncbi:MAG TPA: patatin-like phospholipase family protein [Lamprocystis sp. (in: g-proteobacteria)]|nr:patatin-like phospholipase family protein [Lamprocystis sp. (in: g-proteobacteria)]